MGVTFGPVRSEPPYALYARAGDGDAGPRAYVLLAGSPPPRSLTAAEAWAYPGTYVLAAGEVTGTLAALATRVGLTGGDPNARGVAWLPDGAPPVVVPVAATGSGGGQVVGGPNVPFGNLALALPSGAAVAVAGDAVTFTGTSSSGDVVLQRADGSSASQLSPDRAASVDLAGSGAVTFTATWAGYDFYAVARDDPTSVDPPDGGMLRYFVAAGKDAYHQLVYPVLPPADDGLTFSFDVRLDPLAPFDGTRTCFLLKAAPRGYAAANARTVTGGTVTLTPVVSGQDRCGFWLARRPDAGGETGCVYLAPRGPFALTVPGGKGRLMCGLSGLEYLDVADGDVLDLVPNAAALAAGGTGGAPPLDAAFTTAWASFRPAATRTYAGQPGASVSYAPGAAAGMAYPAAVGSRLARVSAATAPFPFVPYGAASASAGAPKGLMTAVENAALAGVRGDVLRRAGTATGLLGDAALPPPVFTDADGEPLAGGRSATPGGQVVLLNDGDLAGTWKQVLLARTPAGEASFGADPVTHVVDPTLASALLREQLFLVVSDWSRFPEGTMQPRLLVDGYDLGLRPAADATDPASTVLVFKYATSASLVDLAASPDAWADAGYFVGDADAVTKTRQRLADAIQAAQTRGEDDPFEHFRTIAAEPGWTGMLCFGAPIDGKGMPSDLTMLLAGIEGGLSAHHVGLEANRVVGTGNQLDIGDSSVFGVIHYPDTPSAAPALTVADDPPPPNDPSLGYRVIELNVVFTNSAVIDFHAQVGIRMDQLFGRAVTLSPPQDATPNEVVLDGTYQEHGGVGTVSFSLKQAGAFAFAAGTAVRVLDTFVLTDASLAPATPSGTTGGARLTFAGTLSFAADPFPGITGLDLFSYGAPNGGLRLSGLALDIAFTIGPDGQRQGPLTITSDFSAAAVSDAGALPRPGSLVSQLPLTPSRFLANPAGMTASKLGGKVVNVVELAGVPDTDGGSARAAYTTSSVRYAVQYRLPLGSLGGLSDARASLDAMLVVGWGPSTFTPDDDGAGVYVQLPGVSAGLFSFNLQGLLTTTFGDATLSHVTLPSGATYVLLFNNVALSLLGYRFPPQVVTDFVLFAGTTPAARQPLGWSLAASAVKS